MRFCLSLLLLVCLLVLLVVSVESKSSPSKSKPPKSGPSKPGPSKSKFGSKGKHDRKTPDRHGNRHRHRHDDDSSSEEDLQRHKPKKGRHEGRNHTFLDAEREFSAHSTAVHGNTLGNYRLTNVTQNEIITHDKKKNFTLTSHPTSINSTGFHFGTSKNVSSSHPVFSNASSLFNTSYRIPSNSSKPLYGWSISNSSQQTNKSYSQPHFSNSSSQIPSNILNKNSSKPLYAWSVSNSSQHDNLTYKQPIFSNSSRLFNSSYQDPKNIMNKNSSHPQYGWTVINSSEHANSTYKQPIFSNSSRFFNSSYEDPKNIMNKNSSKPQYGWTVSNSSDPSNYRNISSAHSVGNILNKNATRHSYGWNAPNTSYPGKSRGFDVDYSKQFVDAKGNMLPISHSYDRVPSVPLPDPQVKTMTQTFPSFGWNVKQNQPANTETSRQSVSHLFVPPPPIGWNQNPAYTQPQFNHYGNYDPRFAYYDKKKDKKKKKNKFKLDLSLEDFSLEDLSLEDINLSEIFKDVGQNEHERLKKLLQAKIIEKLPTRRLYAAKFPLINQGLTLEEMSSKFQPNFTNKSFTGYFNVPSSPKVFAGLEGAKIGEVLLRNKRDLSPQGQAMANEINQFLLHERDCNETLEARRKRRDVEGLIVAKKPMSDVQKNSLQNHAVSSFDFHGVEAVVQSELEIEIFAGVSQILPLDSDVDVAEKRDRKYDAHDQMTIDSKMDHEKIKYEPDIKEASMRQPKQHSQTTERNNYESKPEARIQRKHITSTENFQQAIGNASEKDLTDGLTPTALASGDKVSKNITRLSRVHQTISEFLGKRPFGVPTKLHPVEESLESWKKSFVKKIVEANSDSFRNRTQIFETTTEPILRRSTRSLLALSNETDSLQSNVYSVSNSELIFQNNTPIQNTWIFLKNHSVTPSNNGLSYVYSKEIDPEPIKNDRNGITSSYYEQNAINSDFLRSSTTKEDQTNRISELHSLDSIPLLGSTIQSLHSQNIIGSKAAGFITEKYNYTTMKLSGDIKKHGSNPFFIPGPGTEPNTSRNANEENSGTTVKVYLPMSPSPFNGIFTKRIEQQSYNISDGTITPSETEVQVDAGTTSYSTERQVDSFKTNTGISVPIPVLFIQPFQSSENTESTNSSSTDVSNRDSKDEEYSEENTMLSNKPKAHESSLGLSPSSIIIHKIRPRNGNRNSKRIYHFYHGAGSRVTPSIKTVAKNPGEAIIVAPKKRLICPSGQRIIRGRCKVIWR